MADRKISSWARPILFAAIVAASGAAAAQNAQLPLGTELRGAARVIDVATVEVDGARVRLDGVRAPVAGKNCRDDGVIVHASERAAQELSAFLAARPVDCLILSRDREGVPFGLCRVDGEDIGERMVQQGWANEWALYSSGRYRDALAEASVRRNGFTDMNCRSYLWGDATYWR